MKQAIKCHGIDRAAVEGVKKGSLLTVGVLLWAIIVPQFGVPSWAASVGALAIVFGAVMWAGSKVLALARSRYEPWVGTSVLPEQLKSSKVIGARSRCDPERDCYHVLLNADEIPLEYRRQWKDDWDVLGASNEGGRLRLVLLEAW